MSNIKNELLVQFADMFKALSNPHRLEIFLRLISCCTPGTRLVSEADTRRVVGELARDLGIVASTVSHHIKELRHAGLIRVQRHGKHVQCWVDAEAVQSLIQVLDGRLSIERNYEGHVTSVSET